jgi:SAM-dependent methyltransferase
MTSHASYGIDGPGVLVANLVLGTLFAGAAVVGLAWRPAAVGLWAGAALLAGALFFLAAVMLWSSLVGKMRVRDRLVAALALSGPERVLDAGCGRGLALVACARKLTTGRAVGVDLWAAKDLSNNNPEATRANAVAEGVTDRVDVETGDITRLPFADASFDVVISMTVIHNIPSRDLRDRALRELARVMKPGGRMAIFDLLNTSRYADVLRESGLTVQDIGHDRLWLLSGRSLLARKA